MLQKTTWMQFLIIGSFIVLILLSSTCEWGEIDRLKTVSYLYKNNSGKNLVIEVYNSKDELIKAFNISNGEETITNTTRSTAPSVFYFEPFKDKIGNSIIIKFDDNKCLYYKRGNVDRIFYIPRYDNYSEDLIKKSKYTLIYIFKSEDYTQSENCN